MTPCPTCQLPDGSPNSEYLTENGVCCFDGNHRIDPDYAFCPDCGDHAANEWDCEACGQRWGDWAHGTWEKLP